MNELEKALEISHRHSKTLCEYVDKNLIKSHDINEADHFAFISLSFIHKQMAHARSISLLFTSGFLSDATIIARVMLEGFIYLAWMNIDPDKRAKKYRSHALIADFRRILDKDKRGITVPPDQRKAVIDRLAELGPEYLNKRSKAVGAPPVADPYQKSWNYDDLGKRIEIERMADEAGDVGLKELYDDLSQWSHWTIDGIGHNLVRAPNSVKISKGGSRDAILACHVVISALAGTGIIVSSHLKLDHEEKLESLRSAFATEIRQMQQYSLAATKPNA